MATICRKRLMLAIRPMRPWLTISEIVLFCSDFLAQNGLRSYAESCRVWLAGLSTILWILSSLSANALDRTCAPNKITGKTTPGRLEITEFAITQRPIDCPDADKHLGLSIPASPNQPIYFWLRLEGDKSFLDGLRRDQAFTAALHRKDDFVEQDSDLVLDRRWIIKSSAQGEALANGGHFDWRLYAAAVTYLVPGTYALKLKFGGIDICLNSGNCDITFEVVRK